MSSLAGTTCLGAVSGVLCVDPITVRILIANGLGVCKNTNEKKGTKNQKGRLHVTDWLEIVGTWNLFLILHHVGINSIEECIFVQIILVFDY